MTINQQLQKFKIDLLRKMPFYGDIVIHLNFIENNSISTAATNGLSIMYNSDFMSKLTTGERNFVIMHEVFHVLLMHCKRNKDKDRKIWNVACDMVVNHMLVSLMKNMLNAKISFAVPRDGIFANLSDYDTVENIYQKILIRNKNRRPDNKLYVGSGKYETQIDIPDDLIMEADISDIVLNNGVPSNDSLTPDDFSIAENAIKDLIRESVQKNRSSMGSYFVPDSLYKLTESKKLPWQKLLKDFFMEEIGDDSSYSTPERKYLHMDLILPGHCMTDKTLEEVWAFVDSSGSIDTVEMNEFLTQLYRISKEFQCKFNICYWDTQVTDVYRNITRQNDILTCLPRHSGGTDINCVYEWIKQNNVRPDVMLILTDGYFGSVKDTQMLNKYRKKTIMVLSTDIRITDEMKSIGKITKLRGD